MKLELKRRLREMVRIVSAAFARDAASGVRTPERRLEPEAVCFALGATILAGISQIFMESVMFSCLVFISPFLCVILLRRQRRMAQGARLFTNI